MKLASSQLLSKYRGNFLKYILSLSILLVLFSTHANAVPATVSLLISNATPTTGALLTLTRTTTVGIPATNQDIYVALRLPDSSWLVMQPNGSFSRAITAVQSNVPVPNRISQIFSYTFTGSEPVGRYTWYAGFATPGTLNFNGSITSTPFFYAAGLNDTGITRRGNTTLNNLTAPQPLFPVQDADVGRDANPVLNSNADGKSGFSFTKLDAAGAPLTNQAAVYGATPWSCVQDQVTGLMWEVKTPSGAGALRAADWTYTWFNSTGLNDGGSRGTASGGICGAGAGCDTEKYVAAVNALTGANRLCGYTDWRLPRVGELYSILDQGIALPGPTIDTGYFPNTISNWYWSASPYAGNATRAWFVFFGSGLDSTDFKSSNFYVRLVRGGL